MATQVTLETATPPTSKVAKNGTQAAKAAPVGRRRRSHPTAPAGGAREVILKSRDRFWRPSDLMGATSTVQHLLSDLAAHGELKRVRRGLYWRGARTPLGMSPPPTEALVEAVAGRRGVGPAGLSAANLLRLSTQVPRHAEVAVPARSPQPVGAVRFVNRATRTGRDTSGLRPVEVALLEALEQWDAVVELPYDQAHERLTALIRDGGVRPERLADAALTEPAVVRVRLSELLRGAGLETLAARVPRVDPRAKAARSAPGSVPASSARTKQHA